MYKIWILSFWMVHVVLGQDNAGTSVAPGLRECYNQSYLTVADYRPPATMTTLIEILRRIEDRNPNMDARELSIQILHRFRQDGILKSSQEVSDIGLPYSPKSWEASKNKVQLKKLTPANTPGFNNNSLSLMERCSLHYMISDTIDRRKRDDESVCGRLGRYVSRIHKRQTEWSESLNPTNGFTYTPSECPLQGGVVYTEWGAVSAGLVLAGIAAGLQPQSIPLSGGPVDTRYASTIAGELSELALQGGNQISAGNDGDWNSTVVPKYYFLHNNARHRLLLTDPEIRGGLDGLYLALNLQDWKNRASKLKMSQILDMYYSNRGVFNDSIRACNRKRLSTSMTSTERLITETANFNSMLDEESTYPFTLDTAKFNTLASNAVAAYNSYISILPDPECDVEGVTQRVATDILIVVDTAWDYKILYPIISYVLENIDVNKYSSEYRILEGLNCVEIVNKTSSVLDFHQQYNQSQHQQYSGGFDYNKVMQFSELYFKQKLDNETDLTGQSMILLMIPHNQPTTAQSDFVRNRRNDVWKRYLPDLRIIVAGSGSQSAYNDLVYNPTTDIITISETFEENSLKPQASDLVSKIKDVPRSLVNPRCTSTFSASGSTNYDSVNYVEPYGIIHYKIAPNYFFSNAGYVKVKGQGYGTLNVCWSRSPIKSRENSTDTKCQQILSNEVAIDLHNACSGSITSCSSLYISVEGKYGTSQNFRCSEANCRFPDSIKYVVSFEDGGCGSNGQTLVGSLALLSIAFVVLRF